MLDVTLEMRLGRVIDGEITVASNMIGGQVTLMGGLIGDRTTVTGVAKTMEGFVHF